jgi:Tfp pilus assembly protein PilZ
VSASSTKAPWKVTFHDSRSFAQEFDRNLVNRGLFVPTNITLGVRELVDFVLVVPFNQKEIRGRGEVIYVIDAKEAAHRGIRPGVGLHLVEFDLKAATEARRVIGEVLAQAALHPPDRRRSPRIPARLRVRYSGGTWAEFALTRDISQGGIFLCTEKGFSQGTPLEITLVRSVQGRDLVLDGEVVRTSMAVLPEPRPDGIGLAFQSMGPEQRRRADRFVYCLDLRRRSLKAQTIRGQVTDAGVENLIKIFGKSSREGELILRHGSRAGKIGFQDGRVVRAELPGPGLFGEKAFFQMMTWQEGEFDYRACRVNPAPGLSKSTDEMLQAGRHLKAQTVEWRRRMPSDRRLVPGPRFDPSSLCVPAEALPLMEMLPSRPSVSEVLEQLGFPDLEAYRLIETLRSRGLVRLG